MMGFSRRISASLLMMSEILSATFAAAMSASSKEAGPNVMGTLYATRVEAVVFARAANLLVTGRGVFFFSPIGRQIRRVASYVTHWIPR